MANEIERAQALDGLHIDKLEPERAVRIAKALRDTAISTLSDEFRFDVPSPPADGTYRDGLRALLDVISGATKTSWTNDDVK